MILVKKILLRIPVVILSIFITLSLLEVGLRIFPVKNRFTLGNELNAIWQSDDELLMKLAPDLNVRIMAHPEFQFSVHTNESGFRDEPFQGTFDIAAIGDSFTFGFGVEEEDAWPDVLENLSGLRVANLGWAGWNSYVYPVTIQRYAVPLQNEVWLWAFFINDLKESTEAAQFIGSGQQGYKEISIERIEESLKFPLNLQITQLIGTIANADLQLLPGSGEFLFDDGIIRLRLSSYPWEASNPEDPDVILGWQYTEAALQTAQEMAREQGVDLVVIYIPPREQVYWDIVKFELANYRIEQLVDVSTRLQTICNNSGIEFIDLTAGFRARANQPNLLYFADDGHWNETGHRLAAELILSGLKERGIIE